MTKQQTIWLNRCLVIVVLLLSNLGAAKTDAQQLPPTANRGRPSRPIFDVSTVVSLEPVKYRNDLYSFNLAAAQSSSGPANILQTSFSLQEAGVPSPDLVDPDLYSPAMASLIEIEHCPTPMTLMLHSSFGVQRMQELADQIELNNLVPITYRSTLQYLLDGTCPPGNAIIVTIDDLGSHWLRNDFKEMIRVFTDRDFVLVVGLIVHGPQNPEIWDYLRGLDEIGVEVASHTIDHYNLPQLTREAIQRQVVGSYETICEHLGKCPVTLILPFGNIDAQGTILEIASDYTFVVGIQGGRSLSGSPPWYLGRYPPHDTNQSETLYLQEKFFQTEPASY
ncbi:MAG: polysaccharide deacetylase family protein [Anaerolineales bacterium]